MTLTGLVIGRDAATAEVAAVMKREFTDVDTIQADNIDEARVAVQDFDDSVPLAFLIVSVPLDGMNADDIIIPFLERDPLARSILLIDSPSVTGVEELVDRGGADLLVYTPSFDERRFTIDMKNQLRRYSQRANLKNQELTRERETFIFSLPLTDDEIMEEIVRGIDECLGYQPRVVLPAGVRLTQEGSDAEEAMLCLSGQVSLDRESHAGNVLMHHASTGRVIGLLALSNQRTAFFTSRTTTEVTGIRITFEQLNHVIRTRPETEVLIAVLLIRSLDRRLRRAEDIQIEKVELTAQLEAEQRALQETYTALEEARAELMSQARFATLGELASGVAHEVNNPIAAITRTIAHVTEDITDLVSLLPKKESAAAQSALASAKTSPPLSTREARALKRTFTKKTNDPELASRLILAGVRESDLEGITPKQKDRIRVVEKAASIGTGLRNLRSASSRINSLVDSLRSYARPDGDPLVDVDVNETIEDTLRLTSHRLKSVEVITEFGDLPPISGYPGQLSQVWTNLLTNAADAVADQAGAEVTVTTKRLGSDWIRVTVSDNGTGIPAELLDHIFEPRFTTKSGRIQFGMGLGLTISKTIIERHDGRITLDSGAEGTVATVDLPREGP